MRIRCRSDFRQPHRERNAGDIAPRVPGRTIVTVRGPVRTPGPAHMGATASEIAIGHGLGSNSRSDASGVTDCSRHTMATPAPASDHYHVRCTGF